VDDSTQAAAISSNLPIQFCQPACQVQRFVVFTFNGEWSEDWMLYSVYISTVISPPRTSSIHVVPLRSQIANDKSFICTSFLFLRVCHQ
jgi:hypothetical protein